LGIRLINSSRQAIFSAVVEAARYRFSTLVASGGRLVGMTTHFPARLSDLHQQRLVEGISPVSLAQTLSKGYRDIIYPLYRTHDYKPKSQQVNEARDSQA
jgi:hypothetical protein